MIQTQFKGKGNIQTPTQVRQILINLALLCCINKVSHKERVVRVTGTTSLLSFSYYIYGLIPLAGTLNFLRLNDYKPIIFYNINLIFFKNVPDTQMISIIMKYDMLIQ